MTDIRICIEWQMQVNPLYAANAPAIVQGSQHGNLMKIQSVLRDGFVDCTVSEVLQISVWQLRGYDDI
jgi:hypothetical protein